LSELVGLLYDHVFRRPVARRIVHRLQRLLPAPAYHVRRRAIAVAGLPARLDGLRLLHVSDLHLREGSELALHLPDVVGDVDHDLLVYTGDFIDTDDDIPGIERLLARMPASPAFAVLGNHDHWRLGSHAVPNDVPRLVAALERAGVKVLANAACPILGGALHVVGVDDPVTGHDDLPRAMRGVPTGACTLLLSHTPDIVLRLGPYRPGLVLAGHTHGGQIRLPLLGPVFRMSKLPRRAVMGLHLHTGVPVHVTSGIGYAGIDLRIDCPPEVALLSLKVPSL
jgi:predicted MPP superfamily phosphohydrolase